MELFEDRTLSNTERLLLGLIMSFDAKGLMLSNQKLAKIFHKHPAHISGVISKLTRLGYVRVENAQSRYRKIYFQENLKVESPLLKEKHESESLLLKEKHEPTLRKTLTITKGTEKEKIREPEQAFVDYWNSKGNLPTVKLLTAQRRAKLRARFAEPLFSEHWRGIIDKTAQSDFLTGKNDRGWKATFDWLAKNEGNYAKILEGNFDNRTITQENDFGPGGIAFPTRDVTEEEGRKLLEGMKWSK